MISSQKISPIHCFLSFWFDTKSTDRWIESIVCIKKEWTTLIILIQLWINNKLFNNNFLYYIVIESNGPIDLWPKKIRSITRIEILQSCQLFSGIWIKHYTTICFSNLRTITDLRFFLQFLNQFAMDICINTI